ncbi:hypothetical protein AURDEDRAFT_109835 [Auricularia subglabra TFB-10046 SS5]|nr:hypothetical protein AURDEDRAFT_109835 [Auricularia subglabra TFB-10046 SS5]
MLSSLVGPRATIKLQPYQSLLYLHPMKEYEHLEANAPTDHTFGGNVTLSLPKAREFRSLVVKLVTYYTVAIPEHQSETGVLEEFASKLIIPGRLDKGEHTYAWQLSIPRKSPPYERCAFGRVYHRLHAVAEGPGGTIKTEVPFEVIVNPAAEGETSGLNERLEGFNDEIGPYLMTLSSEHVTVGGVVHFMLNLASVPTDTYVYSVSAIIKQSYFLRSHLKPNLTGTPPPHKRPVFVLDHRTPVRRPQVKSRPSSPTTPAPAPSPERTGGRPSTVVRSKGTPPPGKDVLAFIKAGESLEISHVARMPDDDLLRPTTQKSTVAPITISHQVTLEVRFSVAGNDSVRVLRAERPLVISSCCCMLESLLLPSYNDAVEDKSGPTSFATANSRPRLGCNAVECVCGFTLERLLQKQHAPLLKAHEDTAREDVVPSDEVFIANKIIRPPTIAAA